MTLDTKGPVGLLTIQLNLTWSQVLKLKDKLKGLIFFPACPTFISPLTLCLLHFC